MPTVAKTTYKLNKGFITQKIGNNITIFDGEKSSLHALNASASLIFENIKRCMTKKEIISDLIKTYEIDFDTAKKDFDELVEELKRERIIS